ncbi:DUF423 domain-containing protein [Tenacibaculum sp. 190524A02b]|uniref:DUF423 domain-containing protein n=1 Tax=Tenacibaculum vairaonense TaxID=3137860 RepID=UPI0031FB7402
MYKNLTITGFLGMLTIIFGAFGAHALKEKLSPGAMNSFETAVKYQMYHVIFLLIINLSKELPTSLKNKVSLVIFLGILLFSGSIYAIHLINIPAKNIWFITPIGGIFLILRWLLTSIYFVKKVVNSNG